MKRIFLGLFLGMLFLTGCAIVNVYVTFPEEKIERAAEDLLAPPPEQPRSFIPFRFTRTLYAQEAVEVRRDINTDSPVIRDARQKMNSWRQKLDEFKEQGYIGETNSFQVEIRTMPEDETIAREVRRVANDENRERKVMMDELVRINNVPRSEVSTFRQIFARVSQRYSPRGTWVQTEKGDWERK